MTPEFLRRYYVLRIISKPKLYGIENNGYIPLKDLQKALDAKRYDFIDDPLFEKLSNHTQKTIKRDIQKIKSYFGIEILLKRNYGYYIDHFEHSENLKEIYDRTELFLLNHRTSEWKKHVTTGKTSLNIYVHFAELVNAIDQKLMVYIEYDGWYDDNKFQSIKGYIEPLHIKEINKDWYLIGYNETVGIYPFCLDDRIKDLVISSKKINNPQPFNEQEYFKNVIGILKANLKPEKIVLKVANHHFKYLLSNPIHHSQKVY